MAAAAVGLAIGVSSGAWAGATLLTPPVDVLSSPGYTLVQARQGSVGQSLRLNTSAQWAASSLVTGAASGVVTSRVAKDGVRVESGAVLYTVDLRPVILGQGAIPSFRDLSEGMRGEDVAQLQRLLIDLGYYVGEVTGEFGSGTVWAVRAWQLDLGLSDDGVVRRGDVIYTPRLPARIALDKGLAVGAQVGVGHGAVQVLPQSPQFTISLADNQIGLVTSGQKVELSRSGHRWSAAVFEVRPATADRPAVAILNAVGDTAICASACDEVPLGEPTLIPSVIHVVPEATGTVIPAAAIVTTAAGTTGVVLKDGRLSDVEVMASATGSAVVDGIARGTWVRTPGEAK